MKKYAVILVSALVLLTAFSAITPAVLAKPENLIVITVKTADHKPSNIGQKLIIYGPDPVNWYDYLWKGNIDENSQIVIQNGGTFKAKVTYRVVIWDFDQIGTFKVNKQGKANKIVYIPEGY